MSAAYRIIDEPRPGALAHLVVNPFWPLIALMLAGAWIAWPWFLLNAAALGSPTRVREGMLVLCGVLGIMVIFFFINLGYATGHIADPHLKYAMLLITLYKLGVSFWLYELQGRSFGLYEYFGGQVRSGLMVLILAYLTTGAVLRMVPSLWWKLLVS